MRFSEILIEGYAEVNLAKRLYSQLSSAAQYAISSWESANWVDGDLETAYNTQSSVYKEIEAAGEQIRQAIRDREGDTVTLYRGIKTTSMNPSRHSHRPLYSWTTRPKLAAIFADLAIMRSRDSIVMHKDRPHPFGLFANITDQQAQSVQQAVLDKGIAKLNNFIFKRWPDDPKWTRVFLKTAKGIKEYEYSVESDGIVRWVANRRQDVEKDRSKEINEPSGFVVKQQIPVDNIAWVLNASGSMEYIIKGESGLEGERIKLGDIK